MLERDRRLRRPGDIARVYRRGSVGAAAGLLVRASRNGLPSVRVAVVVPKKVSKKAVLRNRIRRRISETVAAQWQTLAPGYDIVIAVREDLSELPAAELRQRLTKALSAARAINKE